MALESWAHGRIEAGEEFGCVLDDVMGPPGTTTAFLLVAVDLLLSHWPKSAEAAIPFLACPELLCMDRERTVHDQLPPFPDLFGLRARISAPDEESLKQLKAHVSRRQSLEDLIGLYVGAGARSSLDRLQTLLGEARTRLGPPDSDSNLGDPRLMVTYALNLTKRENWKPRTVVVPTGESVEVHAYVAPKDEEQHLDRLRVAAMNRRLEFNLRQTLREGLKSAKAIDLPTAVNWAQTASPASDVEDERMRLHDVTSVAMFAMRDGEQRAALDLFDWAQDLFRAAFQSPKDDVHRVRSGLLFNTKAIAFAGMLFSLRHQASPSQVLALLNAAADADPAAAQGFAAGAAIGCTVFEGLARSVLRCAFAGSIRPTYDWQESDEQERAKELLSAERIQRVVQSESQWLTVGGPEPAWPVFPPIMPRGRRRWPLVEEPGPADRVESERVDTQAAGLWLKAALDLDTDQTPWMADLVSSYSEWTSVACGRGLERTERVTLPLGWKEAFFPFLARALESLPADAVDELAVTPFTALPDDPFCDVTTSLTNELDMRYFRDAGISQDLAVSVRARFAERLSVVAAWKRMKGTQGSSVESHLSPALCAIFFSEDSFVAPARCYLLPLGIARVDPFLPSLLRLAESAPNLVVALLTLNLLEVSPARRQTEFLISAAESWLSVYRDDLDFWVHRGIGARVCRWLKTTRTQPALTPADAAQERRLEALVDALVGLGVAEAVVLESPENTQSRKPFEAR